MFFSKDKIKLDKFLIVKLGHLEKSQCEKYELQCLYVCISCSLLLFAGNNNSASESHYANLFRPLDSLTAARDTPAFIFWLTTLTIMNKTAELITSYLATLLQLFSNRSLK